MHSLRSKVLLAIISITLLTASAITLVFYFKSSQMIEDNYGQNLYARMEQIGDTFDSDLKEIYYITVQSSVEEVLMEQVQEYREGKDEKILEDIAAFLRSCKQRNSEVGSMYLVLPEEKMVITSSDYPIYERNEEREVYQNIAYLCNTVDMPVILNDPLREGEKFLSFIEPVRNQNNQTLGYLLSNIKERGIYYKYLDALYDGKASEAVLLNSESRVVSSRSTENMGKRYDNPDFPGRHQSGIYKSREPSRLGICYETVFTGFSFFVEVEKSEILSDLKELKYFLLAFLLLFLGISLIPTYFITRATYMPLKKLTETMEEVAEGNLDQRAQITTRDEIGRLSDSFNDMLNHIQTLIGQLVREETLKKDAELEALQYQITPHFMYNTLNSIKFAALLRGEKELGGLLGDFVELLQACINKKGTFITVADEIHILQNYIHLQEFRYEGHFEVEYQVDKEAQGCFVPRLILQPMVENSLLHGLDMKSSDSRIRILAGVKDGVLHLAVADNGRGMSEEQVRELLTKKTRKTSGLSGIGVANVRERLELYYGDRGGVRYESGSSGTTAHLFLPASKGQGGGSL